MREHIEGLMIALAAALRRERPRAVRRLGPRRARGTFVPVARELPALRPAH
jgi:hypothetical protein